MKVGDLVQLSAYARNLKSYEYYAIKDSFGIIVSTMGVYIRVKWQGKGGSHLMARRELKYFSRAKKTEKESFGLSSDERDEIFKELNEVK